VTLPSPAELTVIGTALCIGAGLVLFFLKSPSLALDLGIAGAVVLGAATIAYGYYAMGEDHIKPQVVALQKQIADANALAVSFREQAVAAVARLEASTKAKNDAIAKLTTDFNARLAAQAPAVRDIVVPADVRLLIQPSIDAVNLSSGIVADAGSKGAAVAALAGSTTVGAVEQWAGDVIAQYGKCANQVSGLQDYIGTLVANSPAVVH
jgi:cell division protein FtsB